MTTDNKEVSASQDSADEIASTVLAAQNESAQADEQVQEQVPEQAPASSGPTLNDIEMSSISIRVRRTIGMRTE